MHDNSNGNDGAAQPILKIKGLRKTFGDREVLKGVDLAVWPGQVVVVLGPSGTGKTTLLRCVNRLEEPSAGTIHLGTVALEAGARGRRHREHVRMMRQETGMVFQGFNLWPHLSVMDNVTRALRTVMRVEKKAAVEKGLKLLAQVKMQDYTAAYPYQLSGGQQQRVGIARALAMDPKVLLLDEVTSALDRELVGEVLTVIRALAEQGVTMLMVTHELAFARNVADRVIVMAEGNIIEDGPPSQVFENPKNERTRKFLDVK